jgi:hypothetical protein
MEDEKESLFFVGTTDSIIINCKKINYTGFKIHIDMKAKSDVFSDKTQCRSVVH